MRAFRGVVAVAAVLSVLGSVSPTQARRPQPQPDDAMVDLILGACLSEITRAPLPDGATRLNPLVRRPLTAPMDARLTPRAQPLMTATGTVYLDHHDRGACEVFASGVDRNQVVAKLIAAAAARGLAVTAVPSSDGGTYFQIGSPAGGAVPTLALTVPASYPDQLSARMTASAPQQGAAASAPPPSAPAYTPPPASAPAYAAAPPSGPVGTALPDADTQASAPAYSAPPAATAPAAGPSPAFTPSPALAQSAMTRLRAYLRETDAGHYPAAYGMLSDTLRQMQTQEAWSTAVRGFNAQAGAVRDHRVGQITWGRDPQGAPAPGIYVVVDIVSHYANIQRHCGYVVLYQPPAGGEFQVMRSVSVYIPDSQAANYDAPGSTAGVDAIWAEMTQQCPNYEAAAAAPPLN